MTAGAGSRPGARRGSIALLLLCGLGLALTLGLAGLGVWQLSRLSWKLALIERVEKRVHAAPVEAPGPEAWTQAAGEEYRPVRLSGVFLNDRETLVQAVTELGGGFWVMTPFRTERGFTVLVNRGFVLSERRDPATRAAGQLAGSVGLTGLLRPSEPKGGFLRENDPQAGRWYSRDVGAIAAARGLGPVAPYFVDAGATATPPGGPVGGLTVLRFSNNHLVYALTWFVLAAMTGAATIWIAFGERRRHGSPNRAGGALTGAAIR